MFRVGKPIDHALAFVKCTDMKNETLRLAGMVKNASFGTWLMLDTMQYVRYTPHHSAKISTDCTVQKATFYSVQHSRQ